MRYKLTVSSWRVAYAEMRVNFLSAQADLSTQHDINFKSLEIHREVWEQSTRSSCQKNCIMVGNPNNPGNLYPMGALRTRWFSSPIEPGPQMYKPYSLAEWRAMRVSREYC
jgi:hypothetical protein